jgi:hypothetical protein
MTRLDLPILCATLGLGLLGCGSTSTKDPLDLVPVDDTVSGWTVNESIVKSPGARAMTASNQKEAVALIDGAAAPFYKAPYAPKLFLWQNYVNQTLPAAPPPEGAALTLYILQMPSTDQASGLYTALLQESDYTRWVGTDQDWQDPTTPPLGDDSRIQDNGTSWWINFHQDVFYVEVMLSPSYGAPPDYTPGDPDLKAEALRFAQAVAAKM